MKFLSDPFLPPFITLFGSGSATGRHSWCASRVIKMSKPENIYDFINNNREQKRKPFPYEIKKIDPKLNAQLLEDFTGILV